LSTFDVPGASSTSEDGSRPFSGSSEIAALLTVVPNSAEVVLTNSAFDVTMIVSVCASPTCKRTFCVAARLAISQMPSCR
jgi:hypothetical protein